MYKPTPVMVKAHFDKRFGEFKEEERKLFKQRFLVHDYEVFPNKTLLVVLDIATAHVWTLWGVDSIRQFLRDVFVRNESAVLVGYNNKKFDNKITDAILSGASERDTYELCKCLIEKNKHVHWANGRPNWVGRTFDIGFDIGQKKIGPEGSQEKIPEISLKRWERLNDIVVSRSTVPFDRPLLRGDHIKATEDYCLDDVCATAMLLLSDEAWDACLNARRVLVDDYGHCGVNWEMTKPRITSIVLNAKEENYTVPDNWEDSFFTLPKEVKILKHRDVLNVYTSKTLGELRSMSCKNANGVLNRLVCGIPHVYGVGGVHGCNSGIWTYKGGGIYALDAASLYPNMMRHYGLLSRRVVGKDRDMFGRLIDLRVKVYKPAGDKRAEGLKLVLNGGFGAMGFEKSDLYDPVHFSSVTILGQLLITDLLEKLERHIELIQSNTDGIFFRLRDGSPEALEHCRKIVNRYEQRTHLEMEWSEFETLHQRDISNYVARCCPKAGKPAGSGKLKVKGTWFKVKHCTSTPYLIQARIHSALNDGATLSPVGVPLDRFAIEIKRDKNSDAFLIDGKRDDREWLDVVPVRPDSKHIQRIEVLCKEKEEQEDCGLFGGTENEMLFRKRRKATNCPQFAALLDNIEASDIDLTWYANDKKASGEQENEESEILL